MTDYLYIPPRLDSVATVSTDLLDATTERHEVSLQLAPAQPSRNLLNEINGRNGFAGVVIAMNAGLPGRRELLLADAALRRGKRVWLHWPQERAVECVNRERLDSLRRHRLAVIALERIGRPLDRAMESWKRIRPALRWMYRGSFPVSRYDLLSQMQRWSYEAKPIPFRVIPGAGSDTSVRARGGLYLRTDYWSNIISGGSYGHTCYVAKELAATTDRFVCLLPQRYELLDRLRVSQAVMHPPATVSNEDGQIAASDHYLPLVRMACRIVEPDFIYERLCQGNWTAALLSRELQIPYIVEYNGSEISMQRSDTNTEPVYADVYLKSEEIVFRQATVISVISEHVKADLVSRGVDAGKILVNPNGADLDAYAPALLEERRGIRSTLGLGDADCVVGFTGTFGWWHGIDVLAAAIPRICESAPAARFLLIGDGPYKVAVDDAIALHGLGARVRSAGCVSQEEGATLLKACDIYVSPHSRHMVDSKFFGSPTKIFEYMAMGGGIVASDLEQIGEVLSPALRPADLSRPDVSVTNQIAVLCTPGSVDEFVDAVVGLVRRPDLAAALGRNARAAAEAHYSWKQHVARLWRFAAERQSRERLLAIDTGDAYKDQAQKQWNNNPVGSDTSRATQPHTLEWFQEVEQYRYREYAHWMPEVMEFARHAGDEVLEIGGGMGTDLAQFAQHGANVTDVDLSAGHLEIAQENFRLRRLAGRFVHHDAESLPFETGTFDLVYSNGVIHHTPNTARIVAEVLRVLKPGGRAIVMVYAENSLQYWRNLVWHLGLKDGHLATRSMAAIMSTTVERTGNEARPLVKVYTKRRLRALFRGFTNIRILQRQISPDLVPGRFRWLMPVAERTAGWNLIVKARKPIS
jgi:glycosyltransferase involved in cell wall biosynthesis/SAM-dependent methyltransferase